MKTFHTPTARRVKRVALYGRVSGQTQADNTSLGNQADKGRAFAAEHNLEIVCERREIVTGVSRWAARIKFNELLDLGDRGLIDGILADVPDRLGRGRALATLLDRAEKHGLAVLFASGEVIDAISLGVNIIKSGGERENISRRSKEGKLKTIKDGGVVFAVAPYGYEIKREFDPETGKKKRAWVERVDDRAQNVRKMFQWLLEGHSMHGIRNLLHDNRILPPMLLKKYGTWDKVPKGKEKTWNRACIKHVLSNRAYTGKWYYNRTITKRIETSEGMVKVGQGVREESEWEMLEIPRIISEAVFNDTQDMLRKNQKRNAGRRSKTYFFLLKGMVYCQCGWTMAGDGANKSYRCNRTASRIEPIHPRLNQRTAEQLVWRYVRHILLEPDSLLAEFQRKREQAERDNAVLLEQAESLRATISKAELRLDNLLDLHLAEDVVDVDTYKRKKREIENTVKDDKLELARVEAQLQREKLTENEYKAFRNFCREEGRRLLLCEPTFEKKREILLMLDVKVSFLPEERAILIEGTFPLIHLALSEADTEEPLVKVHPTVDRMRRVLHRELAKQKDLSNPHSRIRRIPFSAMLPLPQRKPAIYTEILPANDNIIAYDSDRL